MRTLLSLLLLVIAVQFAPRRQCRDYGGWGPYEDADGFGYQDWFCQLPRGHPGDHWAAA